METTLTITIKPVGKNGLWDLRDKLNEFVKENFNLLYEGAIRLGCNIPDDYYAPRRVQVNDTRLHEYRGLKYACGHKYSDEDAPTEEQLRETVKDIQTLIDAASKDIVAPFTLIIMEKQE